MIGGYGVVARDLSDFLIEGSFVVSRAQGAEQRKVEAVLHGIQLVLDQELNELMVESDLLDTINQICNLSHYTSRRTRTIVENIDILSRLIYHIDGSFVH